MALIIALWLAGQQATCWEKTRVVASDGTGEFLTVQEAIDSIIPNNRERVVVFVRNGSYKEKITVRNSFVTLKGEDRKKTQIVAEVDTSACPVEPNESKEEHCATVIGEGADLVFQDLTITNSFDGSGGGKGAALAIVGDSTRTVISNADVLGTGGDTLVLSSRRWGKGIGAEYYVKDAYVSGTYHIIVPRGTTYVTESTFWCMGGTKICLFSEGITRESDKLLIRDSVIDGPEPFGLGSYFRDAAWYFVNDTFSSKLLADGQIFRNPAKGYEMQWGEGRIYFAGSKGPDYPWLKDNIEASPAKTPQQVTAAWTFGDWDPESTTGPTITRVEHDETELKITFSETVTVNGSPTVKMSSGKAALYVGGSGSEVLIFRTERAGSPVKMELNGGEIFASGASLHQRNAELTLPKQ